jgi:hypothetical protein
MDIHYEGTLLVPPERGTIIGRAIWKVSRRTAPVPGIELMVRVQPRFVVFGRQNRPEPVLPRSASSNKSTSGRKSVKSPSSKPSKDNLDNDVKDKLWLSIYKQKVCDPPHYLDHISV